MAGRWDTPLPEVAVAIVVSDNNNWQHQPVTLTRAASLDLRASVLLLEVAVGQGVAVGSSQTQREDQAQWAESPLRQEPVLYSENFAALPRNRLVVEAVLQAAVDSP